MLTVAITGGLCSGKSQVAAAFRDRHWPVLDADALGHELLLPGNPAAEEVSAHFGPGILDAQGRIDRARLAARVFGLDEAARADRLALNRILHPRIRAAMRAALAAWAAAGAPHAAAEVALLFESGLQSNFDRTIVVTCPDELKIERYLRRAALSAPSDPDDARRQARARLAAQLSDADRAKVADIVIDNSAGLEQLRARVDEVIQSL